MARRRVPKPDVNKTKPTQIRNCSIVIKKIPANAESFKGIKILNNDSVNPTLVKMVKQVENKVTQSKKQNPAVVIQEKATKVAKKNDKVKLKELSVVIENKRNESVHILRNRIVKTDLKTPVPLAETSSQRKVTSKRTQAEDTDEESVVVSEFKPAKISARLANRPKRNFVEESTAKKTKDVLKKVTVSPVKLMEQNIQKNNESIVSKRTQVEDTDAEKVEDKTPEKEIIKISARLANRPKRNFVQEAAEKKRKDALKKVTVSSVKLMEQNIQKNNESIASTSKFQNNSLEKVEDKTPEKEIIKISARLANRPKRNFVQEAAEKKTKDALEKVTVSSVKLMEQNIQKNNESIASTSKFQNNSLEKVEDKTPEKEIIKISARLANRPKRNFVQEAAEKKTKDALEKVAVSPVKLMEQNIQKNNESIASTSKFQNNSLEKVEDKKIEEPTVKAPIKSTRIKKKKDLSIKITSKHLSNNINLTGDEVFSSQDEQSLEPKTILKSRNKIPSTEVKKKKATKKTVNISSSSIEPQSTLVSSPKSPSYRLKLQIANDDDMDDIYDFPMSSSMMEKPNATKVNTVGVKKKRIRQNGKPGSKLELLMKKSTMNVVGNSCHVQNNPEIYKMKQIEMNKLILAQKPRTNPPKPQQRKVIKPQSTVENISDEDDDNITSVSSKQHVDTPIVVATAPFKSPVNKNFSGLIMNNPKSSSSPFRINDESIFPRTFYMQLGADTMPSYSSDCIVAPDRRTFNVTSESRKSLENKIPEIFSPIPVEEMENQENDENQAENYENHPVIQATTPNESLGTDISLPINNSCDSLLGDSNGENVEPVGHKSPNKARKHLSALRSPLRSPLKSTRSPLKSLPIPNQSEFGVSSPLVVFNLTAQQLMSPKKITSFMTPHPINKLESQVIIVDKLLDSTKSVIDVDDNEQEDIAELLALASDSIDSDQDDMAELLAEEPKPSTSKQSEAREHLRFDKKLEEVQNDFEFDDLLDESRTGIKPTTSGNNDDVDDEIKMHLQNLKKYLPSRQNKDRDKEIFATSPMKKTKHSLFKSPMIDNLTDIRKAFHASTPVNILKKQQLMRNIFMNTSKIDSPIEPVESEASIEQQEESVTEVSSTEISVAVNEEEVDENFVGSNLFNDQSELFLNITKSYQRKRKFEFLNAPDGEAEVDNEQDEEQQIKRPAKSKKKIHDIEKTREFKDFVLNKSKEFAEVDEYQLVVEKANKP